MTPAEHYTEAERLLTKSDHAHSPGDCHLLLAKAQAHATLASCGQETSIVAPVSGRGGVPGGLAHEAGIHDGPLRTPPELPNVGAAQRHPTHQQTDAPAASQRKQPPERPERIGD